MTTMAQIEAENNSSAQPGGSNNAGSSNIMADPLRLAREAFQSSTTYFDANIRKQVEGNLRQFQGVHPVGSKYHSDAYRTRSKIFRPKTRGVVRKNEAAAAEAFFSTRDATAIEPEDDSNPRQRGGAALMKPLLEYRLKHSIPWFQILMGAYQDAQVAGVCISYHYWRYNPKKNIDEPCVELLPVENFRFDPGADWTDPVNSSPYNIRLIPMYVKDVKARMTGVTGKPKWHEATDAVILSAKQSGDDTTRNTRERGRTDSKDGGGAITNYTVVWVHENIVEVDGDDFVYYTLGTTHLLSNPVPLEEVYWHGLRPFVLGCCAIEAHKNYPEGPTGITRDIQAEINHTANMRMDNWAYSLNKRYFVKRNGQVDIRSLTRNVPGSATLVNDPEKDIKVLDTNDVTSAAFQEQDRLNLDFDEVSGAFSASSIQSNRKLNETVGGLNLLNTSANQVGAYQLRTFVETWVQPALFQIMRLIAFYEDDQRILDLAKGAAERASGEPLEEITDELMQQDLMLSVDVGIGATNPQERVNNFMMAMNSLKTLLQDGVLERYGLDVEDVVSEIFGHLGYRDGKRFFDKTDDPTLAGLRAQLEQLQAALNAKVNPELVAAQIRKLDAEEGLTRAKAEDTIAAKVQKGVAAAFASMQGAELIAAIPGLAPIADLIMKSAGYQAPVPAGVDPNYPQPALAAPEVGLEEVKDPRTGTVVMPGMAGDTTPTTPQAPMQPGTGAQGAQQGVETMAADSVGTPKASQ